MRRVNAHQVDAQTHQVSQETATGRKNYQLTKEETEGEPAPVAAESFSIEPEIYQQLMDRVENMLKEYK